MAEIEIIRDPNEAVARRLIWARGMAWERCKPEWQAEARRQAKLALAAAASARSPDGYHHTVTPP